MAVETQEQADEIADYVSKPEKLDPARVLVCLPGWIIEGHNTGWLFKEPADRLWVRIISGTNGKGNRVEITKFDRERASEIVTSPGHARAVVDDLRLVVAQVKSIGFCLGFYGADATCYLSQQRPQSPYLPEYTVTLYAGRDPLKVPSWRDRLPFNSAGTTVRSYIEFEVAKAATD